jgi:hypothetical protein
MIDDDASEAALALTPAEVGRGGPGWPYRTPVAIADAVRTGAPGVVGYAETFATRRVVVHGPGALTARLDRSRIGGTCITVSLPTGVILA